MPEASGLDWPGLLRTGLTHLRLHPDQFWSLTPHELRLMLGTEQTSRPMDRSQLTALMQAFPDDWQDDLKTAE